MENKKNNIFTVQGTIFAKPTKTYLSKKDSKEYEFKSIILEVKRSFNGKEYIDLPEFQLGYGVIDDGFDVGDFVQISFSLVGKKISDTFHKTELKALYVKHPDIQGNDIKDVAGEPSWKKDKKKDVFMPPDPADDKIEDDDLPF
jgi:hypothetical protein